MESEYSLFMIKPNLFVQGADGEIRAAISNSGVEIIREGQLSLDIRQATLLYCDTKGYFGEIIKYMTSGPSYIFLIRGFEAISKMFSLRGNTALGERRACGLRAIYASNPLVNSVHAPSSEAEARRDLQLLLKNEIYDLLNFSQLSYEIVSFLKQERVTH